MTRPMMTQTPGKDAPVVQEGIRCSHGVQGPYATAGEPVANCGEHGTVVYRLLHPNGEASEWSVIPPGVPTDAPR